MRRWRPNDCAHNISQKQAPLVRYSNDGGETQDRPQRAVLRGGGGGDTTDYTSAMDRRHERANSPAAASPPPLCISRGTSRRSERVLKGHGRRTKPNMMSEGARRNSMAERGLVVQNYFRPILHRCMLSLQYLCAQGVV